MLQYNVTQVMELLPQSFHIRSQSCSFSHGYHYGIMTDVRLGTL